jgi:hypothetical protein
MHQLYLFFRVGFVPAVMILFVWLMYWLAEPPPWNEDDEHEKNEEQSN